MSCQNSVVQMVGSMPNSEAEFGIQKLHMKVEKEELARAWSSFLVSHSFLNL